MEKTLSGGNDVLRRDEQASERTHRLRHFDKILNEQKSNTSVIIRRDGDVEGSKKEKEGGGDEVVWERLRIASGLEVRRENGNNASNNGLRSRVKNKSLLVKPNQIGDTVRRSNVPWSASSGDEMQLTRLKSACQYAWINLLNRYPSLMNNNVGGGRKSRCSKGKMYKRRDNHCSVLNEKTTSSLLESSISYSNDLQYFENTRFYKFFKFLVATVLLFLKIVVFSFLVIFSLYCLMVLHKPTQVIVVRYTQDYIYSFMRAIRIGSLPFCGRFPQFQELYDEPCLLPNPFFELNDVSCWPCESVRHVIDLTGFSNFTSGYYHSGIPFIVKDAFAQDVNIEDIYNMYKGDSKLAASVLLKSSENEIQTLDDLIKHDVKSGNFYSGNLHVTWKINKVQFARSMRKTFSRPYYIPKSTEISVQHFLYIDEPAAEIYELPITEFANVFVMQANGRRLIVLVPVKNCRSTCKAISVVLQPKDVLFYNWLFWRPISYPIKALAGDDLSISYLGSFY